MLDVFMIIESDEQRELAEELYLEYKNKMYAVAFSVLRNRADAEDAVMDAVCSIAKNIDMFSRTSKNKNESLIVIIVRNAAINRYNSNKRRSYTSFDEPGAEFCDKEPSPEEEYIEAESYENLLSCIRRLDPIYRDVLLLKFLYEYDNKRIADTVGVAEVTVRVRLMRAKELLRKLLREESNDE